MTSEKQKQEILDNSIEQFRLINQIKQNVKPLYEIPTYQPYKDNPEYKLAAIFGSWSSTDYGLFEHLIYISDITQTRPPFLEVKGKYEPYGDFGGNNNKMLSNNYEIRLNALKSVFGTS